MVDNYKAHEKEEYANHHLQTLPQVLTVTVLFVEAFNLLTYVFAALLLFNEYTRKMQEACLTHILFVWTNFVLGFVHLGYFWWLYSDLFVSMVVVRLLIFL